MAAFDEAGAHFRGDEALALEDPDGVAAEPNEQRGDDVIRAQRLEERRQLDRFVSGLVREPERRPDDKRLAAFRAGAKRGMGLSVLHWGMGSKDAKNIDAFVELFGGCHGGPDRKYKVLETEAHVLAHPVTTGVRDFRVRDEFYYRLKFVKPEGSVKPLLRVTIDAKPETVAWAWERPDGGRSFGFSGLHFHDNWKLESYRRLVAQGVLWSVGLPVPKEGLPVDVTQEDLKLR